MLNELTGAAGIAELYWRSTARSIATGAQESIGL